MPHAVGPLSVQASAAGGAQGALPLDCLSLDRSDVETTTYRVTDRLAWSFCTWHSVSASPTGFPPKSWVAMDSSSNSCVEKNTKHDQKKIHLDEFKKSRGRRQPSFGI